MIDDSKYKSLRIPRQESEKLFVPKFLLETNQHFFNMSIFEELGGSKMVHKLFRNNIGWRIT